MTAKLIIADVFDGIAKLEDNSVDLVLSSPPFLALRSYLPADHPDKAKEIGSEATPADFLDTLLDVVEACDRVLAPHGSLVFELGDTFSGSGGGGGDWSDSPATTKARVKGGDEGGPIRRNITSGWPLDKSLTGIPTLFAWSLAYGRNLLRPERTTEPWRIRNVVAWCRPNPPVGALGDKFRPATSYLTVATKARNRWFDLDAVRNPNSDMSPGGSANSRQASGDDRGQGEASRRAAIGPTPNPAGAPPLDYWEIPTAPYRGSHYATWPPDLLIKPILSMCPLRVCRVCGEPSRRLTEQSQELNPSRPQAKRAMELAAMHGLTPEHIAAVYATGITDAGKAKVTMSGNGKNGLEVQRLAAEAKEALGGYFREFTLSNQVTTGWTTCGHDDDRPGVVLDPFAGSGTTLMVATGHGRDAIGIDLDEWNAELARERCGMFLEIG